MDVLEKIIRCCLLMRNDAQVGSGSQKSSDTTVWLLSRPKTHSKGPNIVYLSSD